MPTVSRPDDSESKAQFGSESKMPKEFESQKTGQPIHGLRTLEDEMVTRKAPIHPLEGFIMYRKDGSLEKSTMASKIVMDIIFSIQFALSMCVGSRCSIAKAIRDCSSHYLPFFQNALVDLKQIVLLHFGSVNAFFEDMERLKKIHVLDNTNDERVTLSVEEIRQYLVDSGKYNLGYLEALLCLTDAKNRPLKRKWMQYRMAQNILED